MMGWQDVKNEQDYNSRIQTAIKSIEILSKEFLNEYRNRVNEYYNDIYKFHKDCFPFMYNVKITSVCFNNKLYNIIARSDTNSDVFCAKYKYLSNDEFLKFENSPTRVQDKELLYFIGEKAYISIINGILPDNCIYPTDLSYCKYLIKKEASYEADRDYNSIQLSNSLEKLSKSYNDLSNFNVLNLDTIFVNVNDDEFKYELEESAKAYNAELYLAAATTAEISIETLLRIIIIKKMGKFKLPKESYILTSAKLLSKNSIIDQRLFNRIESINNLRHGIAHSSTGEAEKWDCEQIFGLIKILVETFY